MKTLYLECSMGAAGDMLTAALLELTTDPEETLQILGKTGIPRVTAEAERSFQCGIAGTHMRVRIDGEEEESMDMPAEASGTSAPHRDGKERNRDLDHRDSNHEKPAAGATEHEKKAPDNELYPDHHKHHHAHHHHHKTLADVEQYICRMTFPDEYDPETVRQDIRNVYRLLAEAESKAHGMPVDRIHFHEVGTLDALFDVSAVCLLMHMLRPDRVIVSPVRTGFGTVQCAHGIMPVPAPAAAYLLRGIPTYSGDIRGEMCTPTGAALLRYYADEFAYQPVMKTEKIGYGMGTKDFPEANCVRAFLGETGENSGIRNSSRRLTGSAEKAPSGKQCGPEYTEMWKEEESGQSEDLILELRANLDDMTGEEIGFAMEQILAAGARDVFTTPVGMKKNRPGILLTVLCTPSEKDRMIREIFRCTSTLGIRETVCRRNVLTRTETVRTTTYGEIRVKTASGYGVTREKAEYEDLRKAAEEHHITLGEVRQELLRD